MDIFNTSDLDEKLLRLKEACHQAVGKSDGSGQYLPLWMHMTDTAGTMEYVLRKRMSKNQKDLFLEDLENESVTSPEETLYRCAALIGFLHDIGKMSSVFQSMIHQNCENVPFPVPLLSFRSYEQNKYRHHPASGMLILLSEDIPVSIASVIAAHHGRIQDKDNIRKLKTLVDDNTNIQTLYGAPAERQFWKEAWHQIKEAVLELCGFRSVEEIPSFSVPCQMILSGFLIEADWISSNVEYFPLISGSLQDNPDAYPERWKNAFDHLKLPDVWNVPEKDMNRFEFEKTFGFPPNPVQQVVMDIAENCNHPGLMIIEAQMGIGKTEAALMAADIFSGKMGAGGIYFGLPSQATANGLFPRFKDWAGKNALEEGSTIKLMHGMAAFNKEYAQIPRGVSSLDDDGQDRPVYIHEWMQNPRTGILSDFVIGTVDQGLMMALNHKFLMLRHLGLSSKIVIIDEVHAYDAYMNEFFDRMLQWLGIYRMPVVLLSATLPPSRKNRMIESYLKGWERTDRRKADAAGEEGWKAVRGYPLITWTDGGKVEARAVELHQKNIEVQIDPLYYSDREQMIREIRKTLENSLEQGGCAGVVVNSVRMAQELGEDLKKECPNLEILIFHSRFTAYRRGEIEAEVLARAGKHSGPETRNRLVVVGTQVIEQSLDVDFDVLISELAPMDLLLQRIGRLHRHAFHSGKRGPGLELPRCYVLIPEGELPFSVYEDWLLLKTRDSLPEKIEIPREIPELVEKVYEADQAGLTEPEYVKALNHYLAMTGSKRREADTGLVGVPRFGRRPDLSLNGLMDAAMVEGQEDAVHSVRDGRESLEVYLLKEGKDGLYELPDQGAKDTLDSRKRLTEWQIDALASCRIRLSVPESEIVEDRAELERESEERFSVWRKSPRFKDALFLVLNDRNEGHIEKNEYVYSDIYGLEKEKTAAFDRVGEE